jgi:tetratricopeptide (TPR) repeat protein
LKIRELKLSGMVLKPVMIFLIIAAVILQFSFIFRNWYASYLIRKAVIAFGMNDVKISSGYYERAIKLDPFNDEYIASYGKMLEENISLKNRGSDMKKIFSLYTKAVEINPLNPYHYADIGRLLRLSAQTSANNSLYRRSLESYSVSTRLDPYNTYLSGDLAAAFAMCGNSSAAERYFSDALKIYPENQSALINMGILYYSTGRFQKALDCFEFPFTDKIFSKKADGFKDLINLKLQSSSRLKTF